MVVRLDWFEPTFRTEDAGGPKDDIGVLLELVKVNLSNALGCDPKDFAKLDNGAAFVGPGGARLQWKDGEKPFVHVICPGKAVGLMGFERAWAFMEFTRRLKGTPTRMDFAVDDMERRIGVLEVAQAFDGPTAVSRVDSGRLIMELVKGAGWMATTDVAELVKGWQEKTQGATLYIGSGQSKQRARVYDKLKEGLAKTKDKKKKGDPAEGEVVDDVINSIRWELQSRDEAAETFMLQVLDAGDKWGEAVAARFVNFIDFREEDARIRHTMDRRRLPWYASLMGDVERARAYPPEQERSFEEVFSYYLNNHAQNLAVVKHRIGLDGLDFLAKEGKPRWKPKHHRLAGVEG